MSTATATRALVVDAATSGIDPVVGQHVTHVMRETLAQMGYTVSGRDETVAAAQQLRMPYPPGPADLWRMTQAASVDRAAFARVWAHEGQYVFELSVASADGSGPFFARGSSDAANLYPVVERLTRQAMPAPSAWDAAAAERYRSGTGLVASSPTSPGTQTTPAATPFAPAGSTGGPALRPQTPAEARAATSPGRRFQLSFATESAIGADSRRFYNHLLDLSLGVRLRRSILLSLHLEYANLNGRDQREHNLMPLLMVEKRLQLSPGLDLTIPIRGGLGFLPFNGPVVRISAGLNYALTDRFEVFADLLAPTFWIVDQEVFVSMNVALGVTLRL